MTLPRRHDEQNDEGDLMTNIEVVKAFYTALRQGDYDQVGTLLKQDFALHQSESLPYGGLYHGVEGVEAFFKIFFGLWRQFRSEEVEYFELDAERVLVLSRVRATTHAGEEIDMPMAQLFRVKNQKLAEARPFYWDTAEIMRAANSTI